jgi:ribosome-associated protein
MATSRPRPTPIDPADVLRWADIAAEAADDKKATDTVVLEVGNVLAITDVFVVTSGANSRQVRTIADEVETQLRERAGLSTVRTEGRRDLTWVLLDYGALVIHVFSEEMRRFYDIERLYRDVPQHRWVAPPRPVASESAAEVG